METPTPQSNLSELLAKDLNERATNCKATIDKCLIDFNCSMTAYVVVKQNGNFPLVEITANPPKT